MDSFSVAFKKLLSLLLCLPSSLTLANGVSSLRDPFLFSVHFSPTSTIHTASFMNLARTLVQYLSANLWCINPWFHLYSSILPLFFPYSYSGYVTLFLLLLFYYPLLPLTSSDRHNKPCSYSPDYDLCYVPNDKKLAYWDSILLCSIRLNLFFSFCFTTHSYIVLLWPAWCQGSSQ